MSKKLDLSNIKLGDPDDDSVDSGDRGDTVDSTAGDDDDAGLPVTTKGNRKGGKPADAEEAEDDAASDADDGAAGDADADDTAGEDDAEAARLAALSARRDTEDVGNQKGWVPPHRLREATQARQAAETRIRALESELAAATGGKGAADPIKEIEGKLDGLYEEVEEARAEGRTADAAKLQRQIDGFNREISEIGSVRTATARALETAHTAAYDATVEEIEAKFPELNPDSGAKVFDPELAGEVLDLARGFELSKKMSPKAALLKALTYVFKEEFLETGTAALYSGRKAAVPAKGAGATRKSEAVQRNLKASGRQPPVLSDTGKSDNRADQMKAGDYSEKDWEALPESTRARLRGDFVGA